MVEAARKIEQPQPEKKQEPILLKAYEVEEVKQSIKDLNNLIKRWPVVSESLNKRKYSTEWVSPIFGEIEMLNKILKDPVIEFGYNYYKEEWEKDARENISYQPERGKQVSKFVKEVILEAKERIRMTELNDINEYAELIDETMKWPEKPDEWLRLEDYKKLSLKELEKRKINKLRNAWPNRILGNIQNFYDYFKKKDIKEIEKRVDALSREYKKEKNQPKETDSEMVQAKKLKNRRELNSQLEELVNDFMPMIEKLREKREVKKPAKIIRPQWQELKEKMEKREAA